MTYDAAELKHMFVPGELRPTNEHFQLSLQYVRRVLSITCRNLTNGHSSASQCMSSIER